MSNTATVIIVTAGTMTFANDWYQTKTINWKIPLATVLLAAAFDGLAHLDDKAATALSVMVLIGAVTARFGGKSVADELATTFNTKSTATATKTTTTTGATHG